MKESLESDSDLLDRYMRVKVELDKKTKERDRMKSGSRRDRKSRWCGCLNFTVLQIQVEIEDRGLDVPRV